MQDDSLYRLLGLAADEPGAADETVRAQFASPAQQAMFYSGHGYQLVMPMAVQL